MNIGNPSREEIINLRSACITRDLIEIIQKTIDFDDLEPSKTLYILSKVREAEKLLNERNDLDV